MTERKFYKTVIQVEVLSEEPLEYDTLEDIHEAITTGDCSGIHTVADHKEINGAECAELLKMHNSEPAFFNLDDYGNDL